MQTLQVARSLCYYLILSSGKNIHALLGNICRRFLLWDSLPGSNGEDVFLFSVRSNAAIAGRALSVVPFPCPVSSHCAGFNSELILGAAFCCSGI